VDWRTLHQDKNSEGDGQQLIENLESKRLNFQLQKTGRRKKKLAFIEQHPSGTGSQTLFSTTGPNLKGQKGKGPIILRRRKGNSLIWEITTTEEKGGKKGSHNSDKPALPKRRPSGRREDVNRGGERADYKKPPNHGRGRKSSLDSPTRSRVTTFRNTAFGSPPYAN